MNFPSTPVIGQPYSYGGTIWQWNGVGWAVQQLQGQGPNAVTFMQLYLYPINQQSISAVIIDVT